MNEKDFDGCPQETESPQINKMHIQKTRLNNRILFILLNINKKYYCVINKYNV